MDIFELLVEMDKKQLYVTVYPMLNDESTEYSSWAYDITNINGVQLQSGFGYLTRHESTMTALQQCKLFIIV